MRFRHSRYNQHNARVRSVRKSCFLISKILTCFFLFQIIQRCDMLYLDCYWISCELAKISMVEKLISKELVNLQFFIDGSPTPYGYTAWVRPIKVASYGCFGIHQSPVAGHQSPVIHCQLHQSPVTGHPGMDKNTGHFLPVTGHPVTGHPGMIKSPGIYHGY